MVKKRLMTYLWRIQQSQMIISMIFWSATLSGVFYGYAAPVMKNLGIPKENVLLGLLVLFLIVLGIILSIGFAYDRIFKLWREQVHVVWERNPFYGGEMFRKEIIQWRDFFLPLAKAVQGIKPSEDLGKAINKAERWVAQGFVTAKEV